MNSRVLSTVLRKDAQVAANWKKVATQVKREQGNACHCCRRSDSPTRIHFLGEGEYNAKDSVQLCDPCYEGLRKNLAAFKRFIFRKLSPRAFEVLNGALAVGTDHNDPLTLAHAIAGLISNPGSVKRFADDFNR